MTTSSIALRGLSTITYWAADHAAARRWYVELLGAEPYFERPGYFEFRLGDFQHELGVADAAYAPSGASNAPGGAIAYWHVDDLPATYDRVLAMGARIYEPPTVRGEGFQTASVVDPFGNVLGLMFNAHYVEVATRSPSGDSGDRS